jgi:hypothetical protein
MHLTLQSYFLVEECCDLEDGAGLHVLMFMEGTK